MVIREGVEAAAVGIGSWEGNRTRRCAERGSGTEDARVKNAAERKREFEEKELKEEKDCNVHRL